MVLFYIEINADSATGDSLESARRGMNQDSESDPGMIIEEMSELEFIAVGIQIQDMQYVNSSISII